MTEEELTKKRKDREQYKEYLLKQIKEKQEMNQKAKNNEIVCE